jgi:predicted transcriptional regulator
MQTLCNELYENEAEEKRHFLAMQTLANVLKVPLADVIEPYEKSLRELKETAKVKDFMAVLISRDVKESLKKKGRRSQ